ncbi:MAG: hypothetical protein V9G20_02475 [Candidatus Promineifilaceae bacterium]
MEIAAASNWRDTIRQVHRIASQHNGADSFTLAIRETGQRMTFPNQSTHYSAGTGHGFAPGYGGEECCNRVNQP